MDYLAAIREFAPRFWHCHAKDAQLDREKLSQVGIMAHPLEFHTPKLPGLGDVEWGPFFAALADAGYTRRGVGGGRGPGLRRLTGRAAGALKQSFRYLRQFIEPY